MKSILHNPAYYDAFVTELIEQDLKIFRIRRGLEHLGFFSEEFYTSLPEMVFNLMGYAPESHEEAFNLYFDFLEQLEATQLSDKHFIKQYAKEIYEKLRLPIPQASNLYI